MLCKTKLTGSSLRTYSLEITEVKKLRDVPIMLKWMLMGDLQAEAAGQHDPGVPSTTCGMASGNLYTQEYHICTTCGMASGNLYT